MSWVQILLDCLAVISHSFYAKNTTVLAVECDKFETFLKCLPSGDPTVHCLGEIHANTFVATKNRPADWLSFLLRFIWKASQKLFIFLVFSLYINVVPWQMSLAILHIRKHKDVNVDNVITKFAQQKGRRLALCLLTFQYQLKEERFQSFS